MYVMEIRTSFPSDRREQIEVILSELSALHPQAETEAYAIRQNELFFRAVRRKLSYLRWLYGARKQIQGNSLLEINELLPGLDDVFHTKMAEMERQPRPGIIQPVVESIAGLARQVPHGKRFRIVSLGSGSMEAERQAVEALLRGGTHSLTVVGFDISPRTRAFAAKNVGTLANARIVQASRLTEAKLAELERETREPVLVVVADNDIFTLLSDFTPSFFGLAMSTLFLHHFGRAEREKLVALMRSLAPKALNYDGYKNEAVLPLLSIAGWGSPVFLNAAVFSTIRFPSREEALRLHAGAKVYFYNHGHYRAVFSS